MNADAILTLLPWRRPFLMIDRLVEWEKGRRIVTEKNVSFDDALTAIGADGRAWLPSVMLLEGLGQSAALLFRLSYGERAGADLPMLGHLRASLDGSAEPGQVVVFEVHSVKMTSRGGVFEASATVDGRRAVEAELAFAASSATRESKR